MNNLNNHTRKYSTVILISKKSFHITINKTVSTAKPSVKRGSPLKNKVTPFSSGVMASNSMPSHRSGTAA